MLWQVAVPYIDTPPKAALFTNFPITNLQATLKRASTTEEQPQRRSLTSRKTLSLSLRLPPRTRRSKRLISAAALAADQPPLDLTEDNVIQVLADARVELAQIFDDSVGITGKAELAELDGPFVKIRLKGRFWHKRTTVLARIANYLKQRIPEILEVDIEDEKQFDDSPQNF